MESNSKLWIWFRTSMFLCHMRDKLSLTSVTLLIQSKEPSMIYNTNMYIIDGVVARWYVMWCESGGWERSTRLKIMITADRFFVHDFSFKHLFFQVLKEILNILKNKKSVCKNLEILNSFIVIRICWRSEWQFESVEKISRT